MAINDAATTRGLMPGKPHKVPAYPMTAEGFYEKVELSAINNLYSRVLKLTDLDITTVALDAIQATYIANGYNFHYQITDTDVIGATEQYVIIIDWNV